MANRKKLLVGAVVVVSLAAAVAIFIAYQPQSNQPSLQSALAQAFNRPADLIELNAPPADGRYPGSVLVMPSPGQVLPMKRVYRPEEVPRSTAEVSVALSDSAAIRLSQRLLGEAKPESKGGFAIEMTVKDLRLFETDLNRALKDSLLGDRDVARAEKNGLNPRAVVRTYEGRIAYEIRRSSAMSAEAWDQAKERLLEIGGELGVEGTVSFKNEEPAVVAYETMLIKYIATNLSSGQPSEVHLRQASASNAPMESLDLAMFAVKPAVGRMRFLAVGNSQYRSDAFGNLRMVESSVQLVSDTLAALEGEPLLDEALPSGLKQARFEALMAETTQALQKQQPDLFVFYWSGHAIPGKSGVLYLVAEDYRGDPKRDLGEDLMLGAARAGLDEPTNPLSGSNSGSLMDVMNAIRAQQPQQVRGLMPISKVAEQLASTGVPFVLLVDACYERKDMDQLRRVYGLTQSGDYFGPDPDGGPEQLKRFHSAIKQFGAAPYLRSENPIVFSAAPGTVAVEVSDPRPGWRSERYVAPLAERFYRRLEAAAARSQAISWGEYLQSIVDVKPIGEVRVEGTFSWSDFGPLRGKPMLEAR